MKYTVLRYVLPVPVERTGEPIIVKMPMCAEVLMAGPRPADGQLSLWARVRVDNPGQDVERLFWVVGTGEPFESPRFEKPRWVATFSSGADLSWRGPFVWHVFEVIP